MSKRTERIRSVVLSIAPALVLLAVCVGIAAIEPRFATSQNLVNLCLQAAPLVLVALAQAIIVISGGIDLSQGAVVALAGVVGLLAAIDSNSAVTGWLLVVAASAALGAVNGALTAWLGIPTFIATAGMLTYADGLAFIITGGLPIEFPPDNYSWFGRGFIGEIPASIPIVAGITVLVHLLMHHTRVGRAIYLVGDNAAAARLVGLSPGRYRFYAFVIAGVLTGCSAVLLTGRIDSAPPSLYPSLQFEAIAAVAIGGIAMSGGEGAIWRAVIGVAPVAVAVNALNLIGIDTALQLVAIGIVTVGVVAIQTSPGRLFATMVRR